MTVNAVRSRVPMELWRRALTDPSLRDLPYKVETNEHGQLVLSPHKPHHSFQQGELVRLLLEHSRHGRATMELAVETPGGIKVPDVVWISEERYARIPADASAAPVMPELVVEVLSASNTPAEMEEKRRLYFAAGALEVWTCDPDGRLTFFNGEGELPASKLLPSFPVRVP